MKFSTELIDAALKTRDLSERGLCKELGIGASTLAMARKRGHVPPHLAGRLAELVGEEPTRWIAIAALETAPPTQAVTRYKRLLHAIL